MSRHRIKARRATSPAIVAVVIVGLVATAFAAVEVATPSDPVPEPVAMEIPQMPAQETPEQETVSLPEPEGDANDELVGRVGLPELPSKQETSDAGLCGSLESLGTLPGLEPITVSCESAPANPQGAELLDQPLFEVTDGATTDPVVPVPQAPTQEPTPDPSPTPAPESSIEPSPAPSPESAPRPSEEPSSEVTPSALPTMESLTRVVTASFSAPKLTPAQTGTFRSPNWVKKTLVSQPSVATGSVSAYDPVRKRVVRFGGISASATTSAETWTWSGSAWTLRAPATSPPGRYLPAMAWDPSSQTVIMFGGFSTATSSYLNDIWSWNGTTWTNITPATIATPPPTVGATMVWDPEANGLILFGGTESNTVFSNATWRWSGGAWTQLNSNGATGAPPARAGHAMSYSESTGQIVMFGGQTGACGQSCTFRDDTWVFDGGTWIPKSPAHKPSKRYGVSGAYVPSLGASVVFGGVERIGSTATIKNDTWAWDGNTWLKADYIAAPRGMAYTVLAPDSRGGLVMQGVPDYDTDNPPETWTYDPGVPVIGIDVTGASVGTGDDQIFYVGDAAEVKITLSNTGVNDITTASGTKLTSALDGRLVASGSEMVWDSAVLPGCAPGSPSLICGAVEQLTAVFSNLTITAGDSQLAEFVAMVAGTSKGCELVDVPAIVSSILGGGATAQEQITVCGGGLGMEDYWTFDTTDLGQASTANVNVANGNLVVQSTDVPPVQTHGRLAFALGRTYNSQANPSGAGPLGTGWQFDLAETGEFAGGFGFAGLQLPNLQTLTQPLSIPYVDRDGTRHIFALRSATATVGGLSLPIDVSGGLLGILNQATLPWPAAPTEEQQEQYGYAGLCVDQAYSPPPGADMYLFRYVGVGQSGCTNAAVSSGIEIGWSLVRPDRVRYDFNLTGQLIRTTDAAGNVMVYEYPGGELLGGLLSGPTKIYSGDCTPSQGADCPVMTIDYDAGGAGSDREVRVVDPAGRTTSYVVTRDPLLPQLVEVWEPGNPLREGQDGTAPSTSYTYSSPGQSCSGASTDATVGLLCTVTDSAGSTTAFSYIGAPQGRDRIHSVSDRRSSASDGQTKGLETVYTYDDATGFTTADMASPAQHGLLNLGCANTTACQRIRYASIDSAGRVGEVAKGYANNTFLSQTGYFWDGGQIGSCTYGVDRVNNNLCQVIERAKVRAAPFVPGDVQTGTSNGVTVTDKAVAYTYGDLGQVLTENRLVNPAGGWTPENSAVTTYGSHEQYFDATGVRHFDYAVTGNGQHASTGSAPAYANAVGADKPIAYYRLNEPDGLVLKDSSGNNRNGVYSEGRTPSRPGAVPGDTSVKEVANGPTAGVSNLTGFASGTGATSKFSLEYWVNTTSTDLQYSVTYGSSTQYLAAGRYTGGAPFLVLNSDLVANAGITVIGTTSVADGQWHHVAMTYDGSGAAAGVKIYVDGQLDAATTFSDTLNGPFADANSPMVVGQNGATPGLTDELALYTKVLTPAQIQAHRAAGKGDLRLNTSTLYAVTDQTHQLSPRGNGPGVSWGDHLTTIRRDMPTSGAVSPNQVVGSGVCGAQPLGNTGLICESDTPASAGVALGDCKVNTAGYPASIASPPRSAGARSTCVTYTYDANGQRTTMRSAKAHETGSQAVTTYSYYADTGDCSAEGASCDLTRSVSAGGWLKAVTDPNGASVVYAYDAAGNTSRTWDRNATAGLDINDPAWTDASAPPSTEFTETTYATPVTSASLSVSNTASVVVKPDGTVEGSGTDGSRIGSGSEGEAGTPVPMESVDNAVQVEQNANGEFTTCRLTWVLDADGRVWVTGNGTDTPELIEGLSNIISIAGGGCFLMALDGNGGLWTWGDNSEGQRGTGSTGSGSTTPTKIMDGVATMSAGGYHGLAAKVDGTLWAWGQNSDGQVGDGSTDRRTSPVQVAGLKDVRAVTGGALSSYAVDAQGRVYAWGDNTYGALGTGSTADQQTTPQLSEHLGAGTTPGEVREIVGITYGGAALMVDGTVRAWGLNNFAQIHGSTSSKDTPQVIPDLAPQAALAGGWATYMSADAGGKVTVWGGATGFQLGNGNNFFSVPPSETGFDISPYATPWVYKTSDRDALGYQSTTVVTELGEQRVVRPASGTDLVTSAFDVTSTFDEASRMTSTLQPMERAGVKAWKYGYDVYGNQTQVIDARGYATNTVFDPLNRPGYQTWTRGTADQTATGYCATTASGSTWTAQQSGHRICISTVGYDAAGQAIYMADANGQVSRASFDGLGRQITAQTPRNDGTYTTLTTTNLYDRDGNVTTACSPRQVVAAEPGSTTSCVPGGAYSTDVAYDLAGRAATTTSYRWNGSAAQPLPTTTAFDADGNQIAVTDANGHTRTATYDLQARKLTETVPRSAGIAYSTSWQYDPSGNVTAVMAPGSLNIGNASAGVLVVDGTTASASTDGVKHDRANPFRVPDGAEYRSVLLQNGGWIAPTSGAGLVFSATDGVTVCATCGIDAEGIGQTGGAGGADTVLGGASGTSAANPNDGTKGNGGVGGPGNLLGQGTGGGGGGHKVKGTAGSAGGNASTTAVGGFASGRADLTDVGTDYLAGSGGGGGGGGQGLGNNPAGAGGRGGGFVRITASQVTINGTIDASGTNGTGADANSAGGGGGAGGSIWLAAPRVTLAAPTVLDVTGGAGGANPNGNTGGAGSKGLVRIDGDIVTNAPADADRSRASNITAYSYDAMHRQVDTLHGAQTLQADATEDSSANALPDPNGLFNNRVRNVYDAAGRLAAVVPADAFTDANSLIRPDTDRATRTDYDLDGRPVASYVPRYDSAVTSQGVGNEAGLGVNQQTAQCPVGAKPHAVPGIDGYGADAGVCVTTTRYDANGNPSVVVPPANDGSDARRIEYTYTDDGLVYAVSAPDPDGSGRVVAVTELHDGVGRVVSSKDALGNTTTTGYTPDGLVKETNEQTYTVGSTTVTGKTTYSYNANGDQVSTTLPNGNAAGATASHHTSTSTYTSDGRLAQLAAPGLTGTDKNVTKYTYDAVGNPLTVTSPQQSATTNLALQYSYTQDNLMAASADPRTSTSFQTSWYDYTPSGQKASVQTGLCSSSVQVNCNNRTATMSSGGTQKFTYGPNGLNLDQVGRNGESITTGYDQVGRPTSVTDPTSGVTVTANYYLDGMLRGTSDGSVTSTYAYDAAGSITARSDLTGSAGITAGATNRTSYVYNDAGMPAYMTGPIALGTRTYTHDNAGRLVQTSDSGGSAAHQEVQAYNPDNTLASTTVQASGSDRSKYAYSYDPNGSVTGRVVSGSAQAYTESFAYNPAQNLTSHTLDSTTTTYGWDRNGNRLSAQVGSAAASTWTYRANDALLSHKISGQSARTVTQDVVGRTTSDACATYTYDGFDRMASTTQKTDAGCATDWTAATTTTYSYDGLDRQRSSTISGSATTAANDATKSFYDGLSDTLIGQVDAQNGTHSDPNTYYQLDPSGAQIGFKQTSLTASWLDDDGQGSVTTQTTTAGGASCAVKYDPFGSPLSPATGANGVCSTGTQATTTANAVWYRGYTRDAAAGSYQLGTRTYQPGIAGFTTPDTHRVSTPETDLSVGTDPLTANTYTYVNGNPVNAYDPTGHKLDCGTAACNATYNQKYGPGGKITVSPNEANKEYVRDRREAVAEAKRARAFMKNWKQEHQGMSPLEVGDMLFKNVIYDYTACADGVGVGCVLENSLFLIPLVGKVGKGAGKGGAAAWVAVRGGGKTSLAAMMRKLDDVIAAAQRRAETIRIENLRDANRSPMPGVDANPPPGVNAADSATPPRNDGAKPARSDTPASGTTKSNTNALENVDEAFHYTDAKWLDSMMSNGLRPGTYATPQGGLSPLQASLELALPPNRALPNAAVRIDVARLRDAGYQIPEASRVSGTVTGTGGRVHTMPGGGTEMNFPYAIPPEFLKVVQ